MSKRSRTVGLLFLAASSVYAIQALAAKPTNPAKPSSSSVGATKGTDVRVLESTDSDPFANPPTTNPSGTVAPFGGGVTPVVDPSSNSSSGGGDSFGEVPGESQGTSVTADMVSVNDEGTVEIHVNDAALVEVLRMLSLQSQKNIIASKEVSGKVTANLYGVTVREALDAVLHANGFAYREKGNFIYVYTAKEIQELEKANRVTTTEVFRLFYTPAANAVTMVKPVLSDAAQVSFNTQAASGIATGTDDTGGNTHATEDVMVVTDYPENLERIRKILREIDRRPQQILIEATILRAALSEDNALGVDFNVLAGVDLTNVVTNAGGQVLGGTINPANPPVPNNHAFGAGTGNSFTNSVTGGLKVGFVSDNVSVVLAALEGVTDTTVLANPKVLALNKQKGEVIVGRKDGYLTTTTTDTSTVQTVEFLDTGTRLIFRPYIGDDGYVRMEIHPEDSSGGLTADNLPFKITTEVTSNVMVKDGHTIVIGGLFREASDSSKNQVPGLGNIPLAGMLFRNQRDRTVREEIIILLTPHIIKDDVAFADASAAELKEIDKLRVGVRRGMMPWGRERLAEASYEKAVAEMSKASPDREKALFFLNCATNLNPKFLEAINLKESITGKQAAASDNSSVRSFVTRQVLADRNSGRTPTTLPSSVPISVTKPEGSGDVSRPAVMQTLLSSPATQPTSQPSTQPARMMVSVPSASAAPSGSSASTPVDEPASQDAVTADEGTVSDWMTWLKPAAPASPTVSAASTATPVAPVAPKKDDTSSKGEEPVTVIVSSPASSTTPTTRPSNPNESGTSLTELPMDPIEDETPPKR